MSAATSPGAGLAYGVERVCAAWAFARSSFYAMKSRRATPADRPPARRRGPKPTISEADLLAAIRAARKRVAPGHAGEQPALAPSLPPPRCACP